MPFGAFATPVSDKACTVALAMPPGPPFVDPTLPVVFVMVPKPFTVTVTVKVQVPPMEMVAPLRLA